LRRCTRSRQDARTSRGTVVSSTGVSRARSFDGDATDGALAALDAYRNADGGFGWGLEPDVRAPGSQPVRAEMALRTTNSGHVRRAGTGQPLA
jgi:hypothetical protein